jgi:hypothetical protein
MGAIRLATSNSTDEEYGGTTIEKATTYHAIDLSSVPKSTSVSDLTDYNFGVLYVRASSLNKWYTAMFDIANIVDAGLISQLFVTSNIYMDYLINKTNKTFTVNQNMGIDSAYIMLYR